MAYDGVTWNEASPDNNNQASTIDDHMRDLRKAVRSRMAQEHVWSSSQTGTNEAGFHTFITMSAQTSTPGLVYGTATQEGAVFIDANNHLTFEDSAGATYIIAKSGGGVALGAGTGTLGALVYITSGGSAVLLSPGSSGSILSCNTNTGAPSWIASPTNTLGAYATPAASGQATADGFLIVTAVCGNNDSFEVYADSNNPATSLRARGGVYGGEGNNRWHSATVPVRKSEYWRIVIDDVTDTTLQWIPFS